MVVTIDTQTLIWGVRRVATSGQEDMIPRATRFLEWLDEEKHSLQLTSTVVGEYLSGFSPDGRALQLAQISAGFPILPYDLKAADIAAELLYDKQLIKGIQEEFGKTRQVVKADIAIIASALASGSVSTIYSNDGGMVKAAQGKIAVVPIPDKRLPSPAMLPVKRRYQEPLFDDDDGA